MFERLRGILDADTAAVLLHEEGTDELVARAARGLEEEVRQGVRVRIGVGFAGRVAARDSRSSSITSTRPPSQTRSCGKRASSGCSASR